MAKNKNRQREFVADKIPLVSVVVPVYNSAKFIPQTLESLLYQTTKSFEVIVVDDCSTDNSVEVVESFAEKFGGRLRLIKLKKNNGVAALPRNIGIQLAHGKYIAFLDSDDLYTRTALEELTTLAEEYQADVVHMDATFNLKNGEQEMDDVTEMTDMNVLLDKSNSIIWRPPEAELLKEPTFEPQNLMQRLNIWLKFGYRWAVSSSFVRKDFLTVNQINFPNILAAEDMVFNFKCLCACEKLLRVPNITYIIRPRAGSVTRERKVSSLRDYLHKWINVLIAGANEFNEVMSDFDFFNENLSYRYAVIDFFFKKNLRFIPNVYSKFPTSKLNELVKKEFHSEEAILAAYLFNTVNVYRLQLIKLQQELDELKNPKSEVFSNGK